MEKYIRDYFFTVKNTIYRSESLTRLLFSVQAPLEELIRGFFVGDGDNSSCQGDFSNGR